MAESDYDFTRYDLSKLPSDVRSALEDLEQEFRDLDITEKGYLKKKAKLLAPFAPPPEPPASKKHTVRETGTSSTGNGQAERADEASAINTLDAAIESLAETSANASANGEDEIVLTAAAEEGEADEVIRREPEQTSTALDPDLEASQRRNRRLTRRQDNRYHSEIRQEAVMKALELYKQLQNQIPLPIRRPSQRCLSGTGGSVSTEDSNGSNATNSTGNMRLPTNNTSGMANTIVEEHEQLSPTSPEHRRPFTVLDCVTRSNTNNLNANLDIDPPSKAAQPTALLNFASGSISNAAPTVMPSVPSRPAQIIESSEDDDSSADELAYVERAESHSSSNSSLLRGAAASTSCSSVNILPTVSELQLAADTRFAPREQSSASHSVASNSRPMSQADMRPSAQPSPQQSQLSLQQSQLSLQHLQPSPQQSQLSLQHPQPSPQQSQPSPQLPQPSPQQQKPQPQTPTASAARQVEHRPSSASLWASQPPATKDSKAAPKRVQQDLVAKPKARRKGDADDAAQLQIEQLIREQLQLERAAGAGASTANADGDAPASRVSIKIQQLCKTLQRPRRKPFEEHFADVAHLDDVETPQPDPSGPRPEGASSKPLTGEQAASPGGLPRNIEMALQKYGTSQSLKQRSALSIVDANGSGKLITLAYGKLWSRSLAVAHQLSKMTNAKTLNSALGNTYKSVTTGWTLKAGDRVALAIPNADPISFVTAWFGCLLASVVPVAVDLPVAVRRDASSRDSGFLLCSLQVRLALTTEAHLRTLPRKPTGEPETLRGWPPLAWCTLDSCKSPPRDWHVPPRLKDEDVALIEQTVGKDGNVMGVTVTRQAMLQHCRSLHVACGYMEGETSVCVVDFKREIGLWHSVLTNVFAGTHVIFVPYGVMKVEPAIWLKIVTKHKASVAIVNSRDLHWSLLAVKEPKDVSLASLRLLIVADSANPWSLNSYDAFLASFRSRGLREDVLCTVAYSSEALTVSFRRASTDTRGTLNGQDWSKRGILSMQALSFGVVRADAQIGPTSIALQDCGRPMPGASMCVAHVGGGQSLTLCRTDEIGELCIASPHTGSSYFSLDGLSSQIFQARLSSDERDQANCTFVRSGLIGFTSPDGHVFVCGCTDGLMVVGGRKHNTDDLIATVLMTEPAKFVYRGRIAVFSHTLLKDDRVVVVAEQRPSCSEEEAYSWMSRVLHTIENVHQLSVYCVLLLAANGLPRMPLGGVHIHETRRRYLEGSLHPLNVLMCPHAAVTNLPKPKDRTASDAATSTVPAGVVQGQRLALAAGREVDRTGTLHADTHLSSDGAELDRKNVFIHETLQFRAQTTPDNVLFSVLNAKAQPACRLNCAQLHERAERIAALLAHKEVAAGSHVAIMLPAGLELVAALFGCMYAGCIAVPIRPPTAGNLTTTLRTCRLIVEVSHASAVITQVAIIKLIKSKEAAAVCDARAWPILLDADDTSRRSRAPPYRPVSASEIAYLDFAISANGTLSGVKCSHKLLTALCRAVKIQCELYPSRDVLLCLEAYSGLALVLLTAASVYCGHQTYLVATSDLESNATLWLNALSTHRIRDGFVSYSVLEMTTRLVGPRGVDTLAQRGLSLAAMRSLVVVAEERPRVALLSAFSTLLRVVGLSARAVSVSFGCRINAAVSLQSASAAECATVFVDLRALRHDRVALVERGSPHSICLFECGELLPGVRAVIADTDTRAQCTEGRLGEIWIASEHNADGFYAVYGAQPPDPSSSYATASSAHSNSSASSTARELHAPFKNYLTTGDTRTAYARSGYLGFILHTESDSRLFVVGALDEAIFVRGLRHYPMDIESTLARSHKRIVEAAAFTLSNGLLVTAVEYDGAESEALDLVPLVTNCVLEEHQLVVGVVVLLDPGVIPINSRGEKQRTHLRDSFLADQLDPIYVAYNM